MSPNGDSPSHRSGRRPGFWGASLKCPSDAPDLGAQGQSAVSDAAGHPLRQESGDCRRGGSVHTFIQSSIRFTVYCKSDGPQESWHQLLLVPETPAEETLTGRLPVVSSSWGAHQPFQKKLRHSAEETDIVSCQQLQEPVGPPAPPPQRSTAVLVGAPPSS
ncbi:unnamed protein product [Rangifer tarandus platyrhynchus]|uniref:Uncharacterized protein n=2 Tax=Rangifer tarandus platyrhynchus TaxID=3082113 RepID=A0ABN8XZM5_RANTA|nr:unnamed protein product [Rangifer tarandus platyrhynchus]CAI9712709.1 unnamed protein product [Rangifer tarandus platyrhynchus]